jgi:hypothetical protein
LLAPSSETHCVGNIMAAATVAFVARPKTNPRGVAAPKVRPSLQLPDCPIPHLPNLPSGLSPTVEAPGFSPGSVTPGLRVWELDSYPTTCADVRASEVARLSRAAGPICFAIGFPASPFLACWGGIYANCHPDTCVPEVVQVWPPACAPSSSFFPSNDRHWMFHLPYTAHVSALNSHGVKLFRSGKWGPPQSHPSKPKSGLPGTPLWRAALPVVGQISTSSHTRSFSPAGCRRRISGL